MFSMLFFDR